MSHYAGQLERPIARTARSASDPLGGKYDPLADCPDLLENLSATARQPMHELTRFPGVRKYLARFAKVRSYA